MLVMFDQAPIARDDWDFIAQNADKVMKNVEGVGPHIRK